ncbi:MAG: thiamine phosphate synthase [Alphaproteobacteria bacterium]|nr:thiamine phosphate synthase [Alphaproteobacteria bacterium]MAS47288.1 thiamine phosphate synthase [Alphaproteobacteria bacterium]MAX95381.1 thiamine phosphate synthase [Alphaproteobacteria bacterium]MBN53165.1 thiamine phosphate synthase [Alphaproteobacteria bacterium]OUT41198.1 MAG: thiamine-phosphate diphosphorylase [Micavibrio sp. TMED2]|tara:strand:+ start:8401 stop:9024 length:624 start_codon:yes stop_codon:yes gene_type:complete
MSKFDLTLYLVTDPSARSGVIETAVAAAKAGATVIQLRDKHASDAAMTEQAIALKQALAPHRVPLIINDRLSVALASRADGLHLGQSDGQLSVARLALGPDAILGLSVDQPEHLSAKDMAAVDYFGVGPIFQTATKPGHATPIGFDGLAAICRRTDKPCVAIGGLDERHAPSVRRSRASGMAVVSAICAADDPAQATRTILQRWQAI